MALTSKGQKINVSNSLDYESILVDYLRSPASDLFEYYMEYLYDFIRPVVPDWYDRPLWITFYMNIKTINLEIVPDDLVEKYGLDRASLDKLPIHISSEQAKIRAERQKYVKYRAQTKQDTEAIEAKKFLRSLLRWTGEHIRPDVIQTYGSNDELVKAYSLKLPEEEKTVSIQFKEGEEGPTSIKVHAPEYSVEFFSKEPEMSIAQLLAFREKLKHK